MSRTSNCSGDGKSIGLAVVEEFNLPYIIPYNHSCHHPPKF